MSRYGISVREILKRTVIVEAENIDEAIQKVNDAYEQDKIVLEADDYDETEIEPSHTLVMDLEKYQKEKMLVFIGT